MAQRNAAASSYTLKLPDTEEPKSNLVVVQVIAWLPLRLDLALLGEAIGKTAWNAAAAEGGERDRRREPAVSLLDLDEDPQQPDPHLQPSNPRPTKKRPSRAKRIAIWSSQEERARRLTGAELDARLKRASRRWEEQFIARFGDWEAAGNLPPGAAQAARAGVSNLLGGVGYWYGAPLVKVPRTGAADKDLLLEPGVEAPLYSAVPSRSFFPRGFLWDEGFHQLLLRRWRPQQSRDVLAHWLDTQAADGWMAREQIRGREAHARVPDEFVPQLPDAANPPTLFLVLQDMARGLEEAQGADGPDVELALDREFLSAAWPRLTAWYRWFNASQAGELPGSFRWRGRDARAAWELNPKTLTSGLDDYPRASHPDSHERHVDLRCWMAVAARALASVGESLRAPAALLEPFRRDARRLGDWEELQRLHYDAEAERFRDWGRHTEDLALLRRVDGRGVEDAQRAPVSRALAQEAGGEAGGRRGVLDARRVDALDRLLKNKDGGDADVELSAAQLRKPEPPAHGWVPHTGYVSLFPLALGLIPADSPVLASQIALVGPRGELASPAGLRSLSASSSLYRAHNTLHDGPYWRGPVWVNINVLVLQSLRRYARQGGPHAEDAREAHAALRRSLLAGVGAEYARTGYLWENYDDETGRGRGSHPFTGWTALVALVAADEA
ncbi:mannosyl oligosaccharide glucosidase [Helicosporidium sp. ATCC 50920]|nr:mannosyl oligosaccharide glucosidase [Helicosporidium sp. ATCC 50920]|eukprot:KDD74831.1 mannosyl oligosaccharide glucosidase [Helicosporidium sp. ATCC 50920]